MFNHYANLGGDSGVRYTRTTTTSIEVEFSDQSRYLYTNGSAGTGRVNYMKSLARQGEGLNSYINRRVAQSYESRRR